MEKCIFLDRFLHHPKDFRKIATFLANKSTKDCIRFYYDSKKTVPYKHALKEFLQRKKRRGDVVSWDGTVQAALAVGAVITEGTGPEDPIRISLPPGDYTYRTRSFHPMQLSAFDGLDEAVSHARQGDEASARHQGKRRRSNWFVLDAHEKRYLKHASGDDDHHHKSKGKSSSSKAALDDSEEGEPGAGGGPPRKKARKGYAYVEVGEDGFPLQQPEGAGGKGGGGKSKPSKTKPQKWRAKEKEALYGALEQFGKIFPLICLSSGLGMLDVSHLIRSLFKVKTGRRSRAPLRPGMRPRSGTTTLTTRKK